MSSWDVRRPIWDVRGTSDVPRAIIFRIFRTEKKKLPPSGSTAIEIDHLHRQARTGWVFTQSSGVLLLAKRLLQKNSCMFLGELPGGNLVGTTREPGYDPHSLPLLITSTEL